MSNYNFKTQFSEFKRPLIQARLLLTVIFWVIIFFAYGQEPIKFPKQSSSIDLDGKRESNALLPVLDYHKTDKISLPMGKPSNLDLYSSRISMGKTVKRNNSVSTFKMPLEVISPYQNKEEKQLKLESRAIFVSASNQYSLRPKLEYHPVKNVGIELMVLMNWPDTNGLKISQMKRNYSVKMVLKF